MSPAATTPPLRPQPLPPDTEARLPRGRAAIFAVAVPAVFHFIKLKYRHELDTVDTKILEIRNLIYKTCISTLILYTAALMNSKGAHMHFINDELRSRHLQGFVALPVKVLPDKLPAILEGFGRIKLVPPFGSAGYGLCVRIKKNSRLIKEQPLSGIIGTVKAVAVFRSFNLKPEHHHRVNISDSEFFRKRYLNKGFILPMMIQNQCATCSLL